MKKSELKNGDLIVMLSGDIVRFYKGITNDHHRTATDIVSGDTWFPLKDYSEETLFASKHEHLAFKEVWRPKNNRAFGLSKPSEEDHHLIWDRFAKTEEEKKLENAIEKLAYAQKEVDDLKEIVAQQKRK